MLRFSGSHPQKMPKIVLHLICILLYLLIIIKERFFASFNQKSFTDIRCFCEYVIIFENTKKVSINASFCRDKIREKCQKKITKYSAKRPRMRE